MSRQIHIPNVKSISQRTTEKVRKPEWTDTEWTDRRRDRRTDRLTDGEETYSPPGFTGRGLKWNRSILTKSDFFFVNASYQLSEKNTPYFC